MKLDKKFLINLLISLGTILLFLFIAEAICRFTCAKPYTLFRYDPLVGRTYTPDTEMIFDKEGFEKVKINSKGLRDYEYDYGKKSNVFRIAVLGDSMVEGRGVPLEKIFVKILEKKLNKKPGKTKFEVINFGVIKHQTAEEYLKLKYEVSRYSPDLVILCIFTRNDIVENSGRFRSDKSPRFFLKDGNLILEDSYKELCKNPLLKRLWSKIRSHSYFLFFLAERKNIFINNWQKSLKKRDRKKTIYFDYLYGPEYNEAWEEAWYITKGILVKFKEESENMGAKFLLVSLANPEQIHYESKNEMFAEYPHVKNWDLEKPKKILTEFTKQENIDYLALLSYFEDYHDRTGSHLHGFRKGENTGDGIVKYNTLGFGHFNLKGHRLAAEVIYEKLIEDKLVP